MAGRGLPVFDRWVLVHTVVPGTGHTTDSGVYIEDTPRVVHDRKVGAALRRAPISYDDPLRYADVEVIDLLIRDGTTGRAILNEFGGNPTVARMTLEGREYLIQGAAEDPAYGRRRVLRLTGRFNII